MQRLSGMVTMPARCKCLYKGILNMDQEKKCTKCGQKKPSALFSRDSSRVKGFQLHCKACCKAYRERPDVKARNKSLRDKPEAKAKQRSYQQSPVQKARAKARRDRPEAKANMKAYMKAYMARPEVKASAAAYLKLYQITPEAKAKASKAYYLKKQITEAL